jgi:hypothetical protein
VQARLAHPQPRASHLQQPPRLALEGRQPAHLLQPAEHHRVRVRLHQSPTLRPRRANVTVPLRALRLAKSAGERDQGKQNLRAADLEKNEAPKPDRRRLNRRGAALNFRENLLGQIGNRHRRQQVPVKELGKAHERGPTESRKGPRQCPLHRNLSNKNNEPLECANSTRSSLRSLSGVNCGVSFLSFDSGRISRQIFHTKQPGHAGEDNYSGHK